MKSRLDKNVFKKKIYITILIVLLFVINYFFLPMYKGYFSDAVGNLYNKVFINENKYTQLQIENEDLKNKLSQINILLSSKNIDDEMLVSGEVETIKARALLLSDKTDLIYSDILLNKGSLDGVNMDALVFVGGLTPVGYIKSVNVNTSILNLYSFDNQSVDAIVMVPVVVKKNTNATITSDLNSSTTESTTTLKIFDKVSGNLTPLSIKVIGDGAYGMYSKVQDEANIKIGDLVYLKSNPEYSIGEVVNITKAESEKENKVYIKPNFNNSSGSVFYIQK